jgi:PAS domain S-box-containing protein
MFMGDTFGARGLPAWAWAAFFAAAAILLAGGTWLIVKLHSHHRQEVEESLESIAELKARMIADWRSERQADASVLMAPRGLVRVVAELIATGSPQTAEAITAGLTPVRDEYGYSDILVVDPGGRTHLSLGRELASLPAGYRSVLAQAVTERRPAWTPLDRDPLRGVPDLAIIAPLLHTDGSLVGALVLRVDPRDALYPMAQSWPTPSRSAEAFIFRRDGDSVLFLSELRHREGAALTLRLPADGSELPAARALSGYKGIVYGKDYRGVEVIASVLEIPASPWFLVAKIDTAEALAALRARTLLLALVLAGSMGSIVAAGLLLRQRNLKAYYRSLYQSESALRESEERFRLLIDNAGAFVAVCDREGVFLLLNRKLAEAMRGHPQQFVGKPIGEFAPELAEEWVERFREVIDSGEPRTFDDTVQFPGGARYLISDLQPVRRPTGEVFAAQVVAQDVTQIHKLEEQLAQAQKMEAIGRLAGGIAHDFNNLLAVIISSAEFTLEALQEGHAAREDVRQTLYAAQRAASLTRQLLAFSRKQVLEPRFLDLNRVVSGIEGLLDRVLGEDVELRILLAEDLGLVHADPGQIEQVLMNLAVNARDAMPVGGLLEIETANVELSEEYVADRPGAAAGQHVMLAVTDTGVGMDTDTVQRIFEPFFTTKAQGEGTGLGLPMVYGIVKQSGGDIRVYSEPGLGTTVKVYLPRAEGASEDQARVASPTRVQGTETLLVVEDEKAVRELTQRILVAAGYEVLVAASAGEAIECFEKRAGDIHLVLSDIVLPTTSGSDLARHLTALYPQLKILFMSGYTHDAISHRGILDAGTEFIAKPFSSTELLEKVRSVLESDL